MNYVCCGNQMSLVFKRYLFVDNEMKIQMTHLCKQCGNTATTDTNGIVTWTDKNDKLIHASHDKTYSDTKGS